MATSRRQFLQAAAAVSIGFEGLARLLAEDVQPRGVGAAGYGPLVPDPLEMLDLPPGFTYRVISQMGQTMDDGFRVPGKPDGMAAFPGPDGKVILVRNHELEATWRDLGPFGANNELFERLPRELAFDAGRGRRPSLGGTTTLLYDPRAQRVERQYLSLACTEYNCAGGPTPWGTWISCEETTARADDFYEHDHGYPFEVPGRLTDGPVRPQPLKAMGRFRREAVAVDPASGVVYQTEDLDDGLIYRFIPKRKGELLAGGRQQALRVREAPSLDSRNWPAGEGRRPAPVIPIGQPMAVDWIDLDEVDAPNDDLRKRGFAAGAACFARAEGMWHGRDAVFFACTNGGREKLGQIWQYTPSPREGTAGEASEPGTLELFAEPNDHSVVENADNLTVAPWGDLVVCEDGPGAQFLVGVTPAGEFYKLARNARDNSEFAGSTFAPDGRTLFVNLQGTGLTFAITGPWRGA